MIDLSIEKYNGIGGYVFKNFRALSEEDIKMVWQWRNDKRIRVWMSNPQEIPWTNHLKFVKSLSECTDKAYWLVYFNREAVGIVDAIIVRDHPDCIEPGYYLNPDMLESGIGLEFNYAFRHFMFHKLGVERVEGYVKVGNANAYIISSFFGTYPYGIKTIGDVSYIQVTGKKEDFDLINHSTLLRDFVQYSRKNKNVDWNKIVKNFRDVKQ